MFPQQLGGTLNLISLFCESSRKIEHKHFVLYHPYFWHLKNPTAK
uniref:Uncharacterized protein n=1 Tax=Arundo donax TaxID=35708 RepID=A0A0A9EJK1_ARUDO